MVFPLEPPRVENMWMKNTYIELDMLFIAAGGRVIEDHRAGPAAVVRDPHLRGTPVGAVLELGGGSAANLSLKIGDQVRWKKPAP